MLNKQGTPWYRLARDMIIASLLSAISTVAMAINVNTSSADELAAELNGVGPKLASAIVQYRESNGPFTSEQDFMKVSGIGPVIVERNRDVLEFDTPSE